MDEFLERAGLWATTLVQHNWPLMVYSMLVLWGAGWAFLRPDRRTLLMLYAGLVLILAFEYQKHAAEVVLNTTHYLFEMNLDLLRASRWLLLVAGPVALHVAGLMLFVLALLPTWRPRRGFWSAGGGLHGRRPPQQAARSVLGPRVTRDCERRSSSGARAAGCDVRETPE